MSSRDLKLSDFTWHVEMPTRWIDNDRYGHMNNAVYYSVFENVVMTWLEVEQRLDLDNHGIQCFTVENGCQYHEAVRYPDKLQCGLRIVKIGNSSVRYEIGVFKYGQENIAASGFIADVFVDAKTERPIRIPDFVRTAMELLVVQ